ncbi:translocation and assembly module lipoprotein TamL [Bergeyella zoohelcum]|uniref:Outer membrane protein omp85 n=1 Tax=Bergeyella zoohelcum TaxID=1015 RepID=A0A7Z8YP27_9FLAO|nr:BamA/TamA family outer membrane protein [Bergeyella zoohelcum]VDH03522.1 Outer membrane protein omp85 precursor [Bergeyella zoohelcum]
MKKKNNTYPYILGATLAAFLLHSCNTRYLQENELLYTGADVKIKNDTLKKSNAKALQAALESQLTPKPNSSLLGLRPKLWIYNITPEPTKNKGLKHWLKNKVGEKPVLLSHVDRDFNQQIIENYAENKGYFNAKASYDTITHGKKAKVEYTLHTGARYKISNVVFPEDSSLISKKIANIQGLSLLKKGQPFDLDIIKAERARIDNKLKEQGFYYFHQDNIIVQADSTVSPNAEVELIVKLKEDAPKLAKEQFTIDNVIVFPDYNIADVRENKYSIPVAIDSVERYKNFYIVDPKKKFKPMIFDRALYFEKGDLYNRTDHNLTLNRLISLGTFKFVKNEFVRNDSLRNSFDVYYMLTPKELQSLNVEVLGKTNSANYAGSEVNLNWTHRNAFKGAEHLKINAFGGVDIQMGGAKSQTRREGNIMRFGIKSELSIPRIIAPFKFTTASAFVPRTNAAVGYEFVNRTNWYRLHNFNASFGYVWKENVRKEHQLKLIDITLVEPKNVTEAYQNYIMDKPYLARAIERQLIYGPIYSYTYTNTMTPQASTFYYRGVLDLAGNLSGLASGANVKQGKQRKLFDIPFSQYAKMEHDFRFYHKINDAHSLATRFVGGLALPYGNSEFVPFARQFFAGGANSIRAFRARTLGPGSYDPRTDNGTQFYFDQAGDIKLELNAEYRAKLYKFLHGAVFADAGNIWLVNEDASRPGAKFSKDWIKEIAVGAGIGLRLDFSILLLRLDLAIPLRVPYYPENERWRWSHIHLGNQQWRRDNLMLNIAIGYPF